VKNLILRLLVAVCCTWAMTAYAKIAIFQPPEIPASLNAYEFKELMASRNDLLTQFGTTQGMIDSQAQNCIGVEKDSPKADECIVQAREVINAVENYRAALARFKASLATSVGLQQSRSMMDNKLSMSATHHPQPITIESHGEFHVVMADGRKLTGEEANHLTEDDEARLVTGSNSGAVLKLPDSTKITLGSNTELLTNVSDKSPGADKHSMSELVKGTLRWVHEKATEEMKLLNENEYQTRTRLIHEGKIRVATFAVAVQGTDFECAVLPDRSAYIKLYSGAIDLTPISGGETLKLQPGQMVTIRDGKIAKPRSTQ